MYWVGVVCSNDMPQLLLAMAFPNMLAKEWLEANLGDDSSNLSSADALKVSEIWGLQKILVALFPFQIALEQGY